MKINSTLILVAIGLLFSCEQLEEITERDYPFVESFGVSDLDETGVTVNFEIKKNGRGTITEYGIEYIEELKARNGNPNPEYTIISQSGTPAANTLLSLRISYDLRDKVLYLVRPFAKTGSTVVYGDVISFESKGVKAPVVTKVTPTAIFLSAEVTIEGDFFHSNLDYNAVEIPGLEDIYRVTIREVSRTQLKIFVENRTINFQPTNRKYDLRITSGGKSVVVPEVFSLSFPKIAEVSPLRLYVGDSIRIKIDQPFPVNTFPFFLNYNSLNEIQIPLADGQEPGEYKGVMTDIPTGSYPLSFRAPQFFDEFNQPVEVLPTWQVFRQNVAVPNLLDFRKTPLGDHLVLWKPAVESGSQFFTYDLGANRMRELPKVPFSSSPRSSVLSGIEGDKYFYFGLGFWYDGIRENFFKDFYRFNIQTETWEKLADFPFEFSNALKGFTYKGKFYAIMASYINFREYDPQTNQWTLSQHGVPTNLRGADSEVVVGDYIYYVSSRRPLTIERYRLGESPEVFLETNQNLFSDTKLEMVHWDGHLVVIGRGQNKFRIRLSDKKLSLLQQTHLSGLGIPFPWVTSSGLLAAFPMNPFSYEQENSILKLIQDFD
jgi:hypothetical protein